MKAAWNGSASTLLPVETLTWPAALLTARQSPPQGDSQPGSSGKGGYIALVKTEERYSPIFNIHKSFDSVRFFL